MMMKILLHQGLSKISLGYFFLEFVSIYFPFVKMYNLYLNDRNHWYLPAKIAIYKASSYDI